jgi:hypothetical protein
MQHNIGPEGLHGCRHSHRITDISDLVLDPFADAREGEELRLGRPLQRITMNYRAHLLRPKRKPAALEAGVAGQETALAAPKIPGRAPVTKPLIHQLSFL